MIGSSHPKVLAVAMALSASLAACADSTASPAGAPVAASSAGSLPVSPPPPPPLPDTLTRVPVDQSQINAALLDAYHAALQTYPAPDGSSPSSPAGVNPSPAVATIPWPSNVATVSYIGTTYQDSEVYQGGSGNTDTRPVIVVVMTGTFVEEHNAPQGSSGITKGTTTVLTYDPSVGLVVDGFVGTPSQPVPTAFASALVSAYKS